MSALRANTLAGYRPAPAANYPPGRFSEALRQTAQLIKAELGVQIAFADVGGWDHHVNEGSTEGQLANLLRSFAESISAFWTDLGRLAAARRLLRLRRQRSPVPALARLISDHNLVVTATGGVARVPCNQCGGGWRRRL